MSSFTAEKIYIYWSLQLTSTSMTTVQRVNYYFWKDTFLDDIMVSSPTYLRAWPLWVTGGCSSRSLAASCLLCVVTMARLTSSPFVRVWLGGPRRGGGEVYPTMLSEGCKFVIIHLPLQFQRIYNFFAQNCINYKSPCTPSCFIEY